jgi:hypothetical protein
MRLIIFILSIILLELLLQVVDRFYDGKLSHWINEETERAKKFNYGLWQIIKELWK